MSSLAERMLSERNRKIESIISQRLDSSMNGGSKISSNSSPTTTCTSELSVLNEVSCFNSTESPSCLFDSWSINSVHDDLAMLVSQLVTQKKL